MKFNQIVDSIYLPATIGLPLQGREKIDFHYYFTSYAMAGLIELDITTKLVDQEAIYIRNASYHVKKGEIEACVKSSLLNHMQKLGLHPEEISRLLFAFRINTTIFRNKTNIEA